MDYIVKFTQLLIWIIIRCMLTITFSKRIVHLKAASLNPNKGYILVSNHQNMLDPYIICATPSLRSELKLSPIRCIGYVGLFRNPLLRWFMCACGSFPTKPIAGLGYGLPFSIDVLSRHGTVGIFPEGKRVYGNERVEAKRGVGVLANEPDVLCILCHIRWRKRIIPGLTITMSEPIDCAGLTAQDIMDRIYAL